MSLSEGEAIQLFCTDIDGTVYGDEAATRRFARFWDEIGRPLGLILCYASGRLVDDQRSLIKASPLPAPDYLIGGVGTCLFDYRAGDSLKDYEETFHRGWDLAGIEQVIGQFPDISRQPDELQTEFKSSWYWYGASEGDIEQLRQALSNEGLRVSVVYSSSRDLDILPRDADKGQALTWLCRHLGISTLSVIVAGDTGNDLRLFEVDGVRGIVVANAKPELRVIADRPHCYAASLPEADGVIEGLRHYGLGA